MTIELSDTRLARLWNGGVPSIAFAGDSISALAGALYVNSVWFWAQVAAPRLYDFKQLPWDGTANGAPNVAIGGSWSGAVTGHAANTSFGGSAPDMNTALVKNALIALDPDILFIQVGTNDTTAAYNETFANVKAVVDAVNPRHTILCSVLPRAGASLARGQHANNLYRRWEQLDPSIHYLDLWPAYLDDTGTNNDPRGGSGGDSGDYMLDGLHPGPIAARVGAAALNAILDRIGVPRANFIPVGKASGYDASTAPYGNLIDSNGNPSRGAFAGTGGDHANANSSGSVADGYRVTADSGELTCAATKDTLTVDGNTFVSQRLAFTVTGTLTAPRSVQFAPAFGGILTPNNGIKVLASLLMQIDNLVDCVGINFAMSGGGVDYGFSMGASYDVNDTHAAFKIPTVSELLKLVAPGHAKLKAGQTFASTYVTLTFQQGATAGAKGAIELAQWAVMPVPDAMP